MFTLVYLCSPLLAYVDIMVTRVYLCLPLFTRAMLPVSRVYNGRGECLTAYSPSDMCA